MHPRGRHRLRPLFLSAAALLVLTGCGGSSSTGSSTASTAATTSSAATSASSTPPATTEPAASASPEPLPSPTSAQTAEAAPQDMQSLLLTHDDLGSGWTEMDVNSNGSGGPNTAANICGKASGSIDFTADASASGKVGFRSQQQHFIVQRVSQFSGDAAAQVLDELKAAGSACSQWTDSDGNTYTVEPLDGLPDLGDQMVALRASTNQQGMTLTIDVVGWRHGNIDDGVAYFSFNAQADNQELVSILQAADAKFG